MKASTQKRNDKKAAFGRKVMRAFAQLAKDDETSSRFCRTTTAARYWMCFSKWLAEHPGKLADETALDFMRSLANAMTSCELAYVLQFETQPHIVRFLADEIEQAIRRETAPERLELRKRILQDGLYKPFYHGASVAKLAKQTGSHFINRLYAAMRLRAAYLRGEGLQQDRELFSSWCLAYGQPVTRMPTAANTEKDNSYAAR